jgi:hypothetical protein
VSRGPTASGYQPLDFYRWPILLSIAILSFYFYRRVTRWLVRISIVQLGSIELLFVNAQPLHKVKIIIWTPREGVCNRCLPLLNKKRKLVASFSNVDPQSSGLNLLARCHNHLCHKEMQDLENDYDDKNLTTLLTLKAAQKATRLGLLSMWLKRKARVWSMVRDHGKIKHYSNYLNSLR